MTIRSPVTPCMLALAACATLAACGSTAAGPGTSGDPVLPDADGGRIANVALEAWALGRSATGYQLDGCSRSDPATVACVASIQFADNPANPRSCSLAITVLATDPTIGTKEPTPADPTIGVEVEGYELSNGGYGTYHYGDETGCDQAQFQSGF